MKNVIRKIVILFLVSAGISFHFPQSSIQSNMVLVSGGSYKPLYSSDERIKVESFYMDKYPVTNREFLEFVKANPSWQKSNVKRLFADQSYLKHWSGSMELGENINPESPVTNISWFAAKAYAKWAGKRLPTVNEWEYAASAGKNSKDGTGDPENTRRIREWYSKLSTKNLPEVGSTDKNYWGVYDMFGLIWEWTYDFNNAMVTGDSRSGSDPERNLFCGSGAVNADVENYTAFMRYGFRSSLKANYTVNNLGFRCVKDLNKEKETL
jgi:formylglycine-generating enzyme